MNFFLFNYLIPEIIFVTKQMVTLTNHTFIMLVNIFCFRKTVDPTIRSSYHGNLYFYVDTFVAHSRG